MKTYAHIENGMVVEIFESDQEISVLFNAAMEWVDVTGISPSPVAGWLYDGSDFTAPTPTPAITLTDIQSGLCTSVDAEADAVYESIGGPSWGRGAEYQQAQTEATAFKTAAYAGTVPPTVQCWATAKNWTAQQAADDILATAAQWLGALQAIRSARLLGKAAIMATADEVSARSAATTAVSNLQAIGAEV